MNSDEAAVDEMSEAFFSALLDDDPNELYENAPCGYLSTLPDGTIVKANETFLTWTGYRREDLIGRRRFQELLVVGDRIFFETHYAPMLRMQGTVREIAVEVKTPAGERLPVLVNAVVKADGAGNAQVIRTVLFDARERRAYETELLAARRRAEESEAEARELSDTLRASFTPPVDIGVPGLDIGGAFHPASGTQLGGDFYDVFATGRATQAIVLGDVCGKGVHAAVVTSLVRHTIRAEVLRESSPAAVLRLVHEALLRDRPDEFCTALLAEIDTHRPDDATLRIAAAGHELPILMNAEGMRRVGAHGDILGMLPQPKFVDIAVPFGREDTLVLYTDGVPEARSGEEFFGDKRTEELVRSLAGQPAATIASQLADAALSFQDGEPRDDIAVVAVRLAADAAA
ncbi:MAG TPA: SpoIIE family protein phosphatase [Acidimicrobiales bacterium]|nr:SpoIIE family protein phosphatase [Acidimicrobiales bacterium]